MTARIRVSVNGTLGEINVPDTLHLNFRDPRHPAVIQTAQIDVWEASEVWEAKPPRNHEVSVDAVVKGILDNIKQSPDPLEQAGAWLTRLTNEISAFIQKQE